MCATRFSRPCVRPTLPTSAGTTCATVRRRTYLAMNGASLVEIAAVLGHKTLQMVKRYAHLSEAHTAGVVARMNAAMFP